MKSMKKKTVRTLLAVLISMVELVLLGIIVEVMLPEGADPAQVFTSVVVVVMYFQIRYINLYIDEDEEEEENQQSGN